MAAGRQTRDERPCFGRLIRSSLSRVGLTRRRTAVEQRLAVRGDAGAFSDAEVERCDEPVRRYFRAAIAPGTPLARAARFRMRGSIRIADRWLPFRAHELLAPLHGYRWPATVAGGLVRGSDAYVEGAGEMSWKLLGLVPVIRTSGPDVSRSAMGRAAAEAVWLPTSLLPRYGVDWRAGDDRHLVADIPIAAERVSLQVTVDHDSHVVSAHLDRWSDPDGTGTFGWYPFGIEVAGSLTFPCGMTVPAEGTGGWFHETDRWDDGAFFRYSILDLTLV
jgi:hypothetical protein